MKRKALTAAIIILACALARAQNAAEHWVETWSASPMPISAKWNPVQAAEDSTYRNIIHLSLGGDTIRIQLTNEFGDTSFGVDEAHVALSAGKGAIQPTTDRRLTFGGRPFVTIPAGSYVLSDPVPLHVTALSDLVVSTYIARQQLSVQTCHDLAVSTNYIFRGNRTTDQSSDDAARYQSWCFLKGVEVLARDKAAAIVALGDSITDGAESSDNANHRWTDDLAVRLHQNPHTSAMAVLNQGIDGNQIFRDESGQSALGRLDRDVLAQSGVKFLIYLEGTNDIGRSFKLKKPQEQISADDLIFAASQIVSRAHEHGIKVFAATLLPFKGAKYYSPQGDQTRTAYNKWVRTGGVVDGVIDFEKATRDPAHPDTFLPAYNSGDNLHPNDAGYKAMADSIDLTIFE
jgi:lysophospholipase L1-like esterase